jgi:hypothetical protein
MAAMPIVKRIQDWLDERSKLAEYRKRAIEAGRAWETELSAARAARDHQEVGALLEARGAEVAIWEDLADAIVTKKLARAAKANGAVLPPRVEGEHWYYSANRTGEWMLTELGMHTVRRAIQEEQRRSREHWLAWVTALTGLLGAVIGVLSLWPRPPVPPT